MLEKLEDSVEIAAGIFYSGDAGNLRELSHRVRSHGNIGARGDVVEDHGDGDRPGEGFVMGDEFLLGEGGEIGSDDRESVGPDLFALPGEAHRIRRSGAARSGIDGKASVVLFHGDFEHPQLFSLAQGIKLAVRPEDEEAVNSRRDLAADLVPELFFIDALVRVHGSDQCRYDSVNINHGLLSIQYGLARCRKVLYGSSFR
ncbi:hypothetical protein SDC9_147749 [bioreactor metagenome]|uniref:Uncharacterized protein n=1 Tax=bioreactor metagenome TaxID=1076179 RepID=A0A645EIZ7_9ZZZZ